MSLEKRSSLAIVAVALAALASAAMRFGLSTSRGAVQVIATGRFHQVAHKGTGLAKICRLPDGKLVLRLSEFRTDHGRDLQILLIAAPDALENETVANAEHVLVGPLAGSAGDQSYPLPDDLDVHKFRAVTIWSSKYLVNFTTAPLLLE
jgi:hypothetical protein